MRHFLQLLQLVCLFMLVCVRNLCNVLFSKLASEVIQGAENDIHWLKGGLMKIWEGKKSIFYQVRIFITSEHTRHLMYIVIRNVIIIIMYVTTSVKNYLVTYINNILFS
jgi:hypothetical protein